MQMLTKVCFLGQLLQECQENRLGPRKEFSTVIRRASANPMGAGTTLLSGRTSRQGRLGLTALRGDMGDFPGDMT